MFFIRSLLSLRISETKANYRNGDKLKNAGVASYVLSKDHDLEDRQIVIIVKHIYSLLCNTMYDSSPLLKIN